MPFSALYQFRNPRNVEISRTCEAGANPWVRLSARKSTIISVLNFSGLRPPFEAKNRQDLVKSRL